jgi:glucose/arabinose dehydrogenase
LKILAGIALVLLIAVAAIHAWLPPVNLPLSNALSSLAPSWFDAPQADVSRLRVPAGFELALFADRVDDARVLRATPEGDLIVASPRTGSVWWLKRDVDGDGATDERRLLKAGLDGPNGLDLKDGYLYIAEQQRIGRAAFDSTDGKLTGDYQPLIEGLPGGGNHSKKTLRFGPDGLMYVAVGSSCNVCLEDDERRAAISRYTADGEPRGIYATGLRNSAGFDWSPNDGALYATDNGRDLLGDDFPPCELNRVEEGGFYGWPFANGNREPDPDLGAGREAVIAASQSPVFPFRAHNAPLGIVFLRHAAPPWAGAALVALHGSWNRTLKDGYKVVALRWGPNGTIEAQDFVTGFLVDDEVFGRPAELAEAPDGTIYVSDDFANAVYRIVAHGAGAAA